MSGDARSVYDSLGGRYDRWAAVMAGVFPLTRLREQVLREARGDALELAVGTGNNLPYYPTGVRLTGVDFSRPMLEIAGRRALALGVDFTGLTADAEALPFAAARFDTVVCTLAACTFRRPDRVFAEMRRVLRPDGVALLVEHVQAEGFVGRTLLSGITPLTVRFLGCHPDRHTAQTLALAGFVLSRVERAVGGVLLGIVAAPA